MVNFRSKRFFAFIISTILLVILSLTTDYPIIEISGAITMLTGVYIGADTLRKSI